jgi:hypothetical protein
MSQKPYHRVLVFRPPEDFYDELQSERWEANVAENLNEHRADGYFIAAVSVIDDVLVYTLERRKP